MSIIKIRSALETALNGMSPALATSWENVPFTSVAGTPYQQVFLNPHEPDNPTMGDDFYRERGIFQINLRYPLQTGALAAANRAQLIRTTFKRGASFINNGVAVTVEKTPEIGVGAAVDDRWFLPVRIYYFSNI